MRFFSGSYTEPSWRTIAKTLRIGQENARNISSWSIHKLKIRHNLISALRQGKAA